jgi:hypothetical protein
MKTLLHILFLLFLQTSCSNHQPSTKNQDLDFIYKTIKENHPGIYNEQDSGFKNHLEKEYKKASRLLARNSDIENEKQIIKNFAASFNDAHLWVSYFDDKKISPNTLENQKKFEVKNINKEVAWITLPTFDLDKNQQKDFNIMLKTLTKLRNKKLIVFDLCSNEGGNSEYGSRIASRLWGKKYADSKRNEKRGAVFVDWRASEDNLVHLKGVYERYKAQWIKDVADGLQKALKKNQSYYREGPDAQQEQKMHYHNLVMAKIVVIIDSGNFSAALDFIDELKMMSSRVILIGKQTKADRLYMEVRDVPLPSGMGSFALPIKVYRGRIRGDNVPYKPDFEYDVRDDEGLEKFVLEAGIDK